MKGEKGERSGPGGIRTLGPSVKSRLLYLAELRAPFRPLKKVDVHKPFATCLYRPQSTGTANSYY